MLLNVAVQCGFPVIYTKKSNYKPFICGFFEGSIMRGVIIRFPFYLYLIKKITYFPKLTHFTFQVAILQYTTRRIPVTFGMRSGIRFHNVESQQRF